MKYRATGGTTALPPKVLDVVDHKELVEEQDYKPKLDWEADDRASIGFSVMSQSIRAVVEFDDDELRIDGKVPLLFRPFQRKIEAVLGSEMEKWLDKARRGEI